ncbi:MAG: 2-oxoacid:ferredoxin oxidoreductase subunit beta [Pseudomonadota bacterium]
MPVKDYIRERFFPHLWCPGCGHGIVLNALIRAIEKLGLSKNEIAMVSGIGCSSRISGYVDFHTLHTIHGRALAFATGLKLGLPSLNVIVPMGDGDALAIGGNHFIHAARRNIEMTAIIMNNRIYGMTGGQYSPLSGYGTMATTAPFSNIDHDFDVVDLSVAAGATFVARTTTFHVHQLIDLLQQAILHEGFSVVEVLSQCPTYFGRKNKMGSAVDMMTHYKNQTTQIGSKAKKENPALIERGVFVQKEMPEYCKEYDKIIERAMGRSESTPIP